VTARSDFVFLAMLTLAKLGNLGLPFPMVSFQNNVHSKGVLLAGKSRTQAKKSCYDTGNS